MVARIAPKPNPAVTGPGGGAVIRPMYGIFIRDNLANFRNDISNTLANTKTAIANGSATAPEIIGDGKLQGSELKKAKLAAKDLEKALKALKPVFASLEAATPTKPAKPAAGGFPGAGSGGGMIRPMYGMVMRDDLARFRANIQANSTQIRSAVNSGQLKGADKTEAQKALKYLDAALKDLNSAATVLR